MVWKGRRIWGEEREEGGTGDRQIHRHRHRQWTRAERIRNGTDENEGKRTGQGETGIGTGTAEGAKRVKVAGRRETEVRDTARRHARLRTGVTITARVGTPRVAGRERALQRGGPGEAVRRSPSRTVSSSSLPWGREKAVRNFSGKHVNWPLYCLTGYLM